MSVDTHIAKHPNGDKIQMLILFAVIVIFAVLYFIPNSRGERNELSTEEEETDTEALLRKKRLEKFQPQQASATNDAAAQESNSIPTSEAQNIETSQVDKKKEKKMKRKNKDSQVGQVLSEKRNELPTGEEEIDTEGVLRKRRLEKLQPQQASATNNAAAQKSNSIPTSETQNIETSQEDKKKEKKMKRKKKDSQVGQVLSEILTFITKRAVSVITIQDDDVRNRYEPRQSKASSYPKKEVISIRISRTATSTPSEQTQETSSPRPEQSTNLIISFPSTHHDSILALQPSNVEEATLWHKQICDVKRDGYSFCSLDKKHPEFNAYNKFMTQFMKQIIRHVINHLMKDDDHESEEESDDEEDLFAEGYDNTPMERQEASHKSNNDQGGDGIDDLLSLIEQITPNMNLRFLDALLSIDLQQRPSTTATSSTSKKTLPQRLIKRSILRFEDTFKQSFDATKEALGFSRILNHSKICEKVLMEYIRDEVKLFSNGSMTGLEIEKKSLLRPLFQASAMSVPKVGTELLSDLVTTAIKKVTKSTFQQELEELPGFPTCIFRSDFQSNRIVNNFKGQCYKQSETRRNATEVALDVAFQHGGKDFSCWLKHIIRANDTMGSLSHNELLATESCTSICSSRSYLFGLVVAVLGISCKKLEEKIRENGGKTFFNNQYLPHLDTQNGSSTNGIDKLTELFFLTATLLRVSFYPAMQMQREFMSHPSTQHVLNVIQQVAETEKDKTAATQDVSPDQMSLFKGVMTSYVGWNIFLHDPIVLERMTKFAVIQLKWLKQTIHEDDECVVNRVPEWMCKQPALWLSHVARVSPHEVTPEQAAISVECVIELLEVSTNASTGRAFSPVVVDALVSILSSFVIAGKIRSKRKQRRFGTDYEEEEDDLDAYQTLDRNNLGVDVFTNDQVRNGLCPILIKTFGTFDAVEGLDVDIEHDFDKYSARSKIAELLLFLWKHPNVEFRESILRLKDDTLADFANKVALAIGTMFDFGCDKLAEVSAIKRQTITASMDAKSKNIERYITSNITFARRWTCLLLQLSRETRLCKVLGGPSAAKKLSALIIQFIDVLTEEDGGIKESLDSIAERSDQMINSRNDDSALNFMKSRWYMREVYGLDVSKFCHQFLALLSSWHKESKGFDGTSPILEAFASNQDVEISRYRNIFRRFIANRPPKISSLNNTDDVRAIFERDGFVDSINFHHQFRDGISIDPQIKDQIRKSRSNQMKIEDIIALASNEDILAFLDAAESIINKQEDLKQEAATAKAFDEIMNSEDLATEDFYGEKLNNWTMKFQSFVSEHDPDSYAHYYNGNAKNRNIAGPVKELMKHVERCRKQLPIPHVDSTAFICFEEDRMDLCRTAITGPVDSPYAHGIFIFDVFLPSTFPNIPPLMTFMTTGGGQFRFNPNLYADGKVCLSLLGTFNSSDESQKWNPDYSSIAQVLLSIQTQILVEEPYFNEPGAEEFQGTPIGNQRSQEQNLKIRLATLRFAIIDHIKHPPTGFEDVSRLHFALCRKRILLQAKRWMDEAKSTNMYGRFDKAYRELVTLFSSMDVTDVPALPPVDSDVSYFDSVE